MSEANAINSNTTGIVGNTGTSITATPVTAHAIQVGGSTSSTLVQLSVGATGTVLAGSTGADPAFTATPTVTSITISNAPVSGTDGTNKSYVDSAITAVNPATSVVAATNGALTVTYLNGVSGIGATLTNAGAQAAFQIDGQSPTVNQRVLIKDQASTFQNGVYTVTVVGTGVTNWVLTRALDYDQPSDINNTGVINVLNGTANALTGWLINSTVNTVGTDAITYVQYNVAPITTTQHSVLIGGATNSIASLAVAATGTVLSGNTGADPSFTATPSVTSITLSSGSALANYSTGTFTPNLAFGGSSTGITYTNQLGKYWRIGSVVYYDIFLQLSSKGAQTGGATITNLPFTCANDTHFPAGTVILGTAANAYPANCTSLITFISPNTTILSFFAQGSTSAGSQTVTNTTFANTTQVQATGFYWLT